MVFLVATIQQLTMAYYICMCTCVCVWGGGGGCMGGGGGNTECVQKKYSYIVPNAIPTVS